MKKEKVLAITFITFALLILTLNISSASFFSNFFNKDPELGPVPVTIDLANSPPQIVKFWRVNDVPLLTGAPFNLPQQPFNLVAQGTTDLNIGFIAEDPDTASDLPNLNLGSSPIGIIGGGIQAPASSVNPSYQLAINSCTSIDCTTGQTPGGIPTTAPFPACDPTKLANQKAYFCTIPAIYYSPPSTSTTVANDLWRIGVTILDISGAISPTVTSGISTGFQNTPNDFLRINSLNAANPVSGSSINFPSLSLTIPNQPASAPFIVENLGNTPLPTNTISGMNLIGTINPSASIAVSAFSASGNSGGSTPAQCIVPGSASALIHNSNVLIPNGGVPYTAQGSSIDRKNIFACAYLTPILSGGTDSQFSATWTVTLSP
jgi:hypothetical protein